MSIGSMAFGCPWPVPPGPSGKVFADSGGGLWVTARELVHLKKGVVASHFELAGTHGFQSISEDPEGTVWVGLRGEDAPLCSASDHGVTCFGKNDGLPLSESMRCCPMAAVAYGWEDRPPSFAGTVVVCPKRTRSKPPYRVWPARPMERSGWACSRRDQGWGFKSCATVF